MLIERRLDHSRHSRTGPGGRELLLPCRRICMGRSANERSCYGSFATFHPRGGRSL
jgi:hypothetical protein